MHYFSDLLLLFFPVALPATQPSTKCCPFPNLTTAVLFIFTKKQLTPSPPYVWSPQTTFDQYPKRTRSTNYVSTTKHFEHSWQALMDQLSTFHGGAHVLC